MISQILQSTVDDYNFALICIIVLFLIYFEKRKVITNKSSYTDRQFIHGTGKPIRVTT